MAERRMFAKSVVDNDNFLDMPVTAQNLYFHLGVRADDDGFIGNPKSIMRTVNASNDDLKLLAIKGFIIPFESGICVIRHWKIHNHIQKDRYRETLYTDEKSLLSVDTTKIYDLCIQNVSNLDTQVRIGKVSQGKDR